MPPLVAEKNYLEVRVYAKNANGIIIGVQGSIDMLARHFVWVDRQRIAFRREGAGPAMLMVHGITTYSFMWEGMMRPLSKRFDVLAPDLLGCGESDKPMQSDYSIAAQAELMIKFLDAMEIPNVHLVCHDIGGGVGQILAIKHPERVRSLTLINSVAYDYWPVQPIVTLRIPILRQIALATLDAGLFKAIVKHGFYHKELVTDELMEHFRRPLLTLGGREGFLRLAKCLDSSQLMDISDRLKQLQMPVLIIRGETDAYLKPIISERLHSDIPNSVLKKLSTAGHFTPMDEPDMVAEMLSEFIKASDSQKASTPA